MLAIQTFATAKSSRWSFVSLGGAGAAGGYMLGAAISWGSMFVLGLIAVAGCLAGVVRCQM